MNEKYTEFNELVNLGERICITIKQLYFADTPWNECYRKVGDKFTEVKRKARKCLPQMNEKEMLKELRNFSTTDIEDMMDDAKEEAVSGEQVTKNAGHMDAVKKNTTSLHSERRP